MKTLCFPAALALLVLLAGQSHAQSILERVLLLLDYPSVVALNLSESIYPNGSIDVFDPRFTGVDGSITTAIYGLNPDSSDPVSVSYIAVQQGLVALELGLAETTAIGGVNTGLIGLSPVEKTDALGISIAVGVQAALDEAQTLSAHAVAASAGVLGGAAGTNYLAANTSVNLMGVQGQVTNILDGVSAKVGAVRATALGAVNTGAIASGVETIVKGLTGVSGGTMN